MIPVNIPWMTTIRSKFIIIMLIIICVVAISIAYVGYLSYLHGIQKHIGLSTMKITAQLSQNIDNYLQKYQDLTVLPHYDRKIESLLSERSRMSANDRALQDISIKDILNLTYIYPYREISSVHLYLPEQEKIELFQDGYEVKSADLRDSAWFQAGIAEEGRLVVADSQILYQGGNRIPVISFIRQLNILESNTPYATFVITIPLDQISQLCQTASSSTEATYIILNKWNKVIYAQNSYVYGEAYPNPLIDPSQPNIIANHGKKDLISYHTSPKSGWKIVSVIPIAALTNQSVWIRNTIAFTSFLVIIVGILLSLWFTSLITKPILKLKQLMKVVETGDFNSTFKSNGNDELNLLGMSFNRMTLKIKDLIENVYMLEILQKDAKLNALQAQINPHFLFNTLETIRMIAEVQNNQHISRLIQSLGNLLRETISLGRKLITIQNEIEYISNYTMIQSYRYQSLKVELDMEEQIKGYYIPPLLLQPLVENSIEHGFKSLKGIKQIRIKGHQEEHNRLIFTIEDNGIGMSHIQTEQLNQTINSLELPAGKHGIGLWNVQQRISLQFGSGYGLQFIHSDMQGTRIRMHIPIIDKEA